MKKDDGYYLKFDRGSFYYEICSCGITPRIYSIGHEFTYYYENESYIIEMEFCERDDLNDILHTYQNEFLSEIGFDVKDYLYLNNSGKFIQRMNEELILKTDFRFPTEQHLISWLRSLLSNGDIEDELKRVGELERAYCASDFEDESLKDFTDILMSEKL